MKIKEENERNERKEKGDSRRNEMKEKEGDLYIKMKNIHFNPPGKFTFKTNSFSCNLVQNCNLVRKLIPN